MGAYGVNRNIIGAKFWVIIAAAALLFMLLHPLSGGILQTDGGHSFQPGNPENPQSAPDGSPNAGPSVSADALGGSAFTSGSLGSWVNNIISGGGGSGSGSSGGSGSGGTAGPNSPTAPGPTWPVINSINPASGPTAGSTLVVINGSGFTGVTGVDFGTTPALSYTFISDSNVTALSPPGSGTIDVRVTTGAGTSDVTPADEFTYIGKPAPPVPEFPTPVLPLAGIICFLIMVNSLRKGTLTHPIGKPNL